MSEINTEIIHEWTDEDFRERNIPNYGRDLLKRKTHPFYEMRDLIESDNDFTDKIRSKFFELCNKIIEKNISTVFFLDKSARPAYWVFRSFWKKYYPDKNVSLLEVSPKTGRMHQIRIHLKYIGHPIIGDQVYFNKASRRLSKELNICRQFLHASELTFSNPQTHKKQTFKSELPNELKQMLDK